MQKYLICSDIHGSAERCEKVLNQFKALNCDKIILLGDILYHGPRNPLPQGHNPKAVVEMLNEMADKVIACRGNCDAEVDQMVLKFQIMADYVQLIDENTTLFCTHGHVYAPLLANGTKPEGTDPSNKTPQLFAPAVCFYGHTHVPVLEKNKEGILICNPGSTSLPKNDSEPGFAVFENKTVTLYNLDGKILKALAV